MIFYRYYRPGDALLVLRDLEIRTSIPKTLNDPFELSPNIDPAQFTQSRCEAFLRQDYNIDHWYHVEGRKRGFTNKKSFKRWYLKDVPRRAAALLPRVPKNVEGVRKDFLNSFSNRWRLICGSRVPDSILMWSHYAQNHTGMVIGFDTGQVPFSQIGEDYILPVNYSETKANYVHFSKQPEFERQLFVVATTKSSAWSYEQEVRVILAASPKTLREMQFLPITPESISATYLGCRIEPAIRNSMNEILSQQRLRHVSVFGAELHPSEYALRMTQVR
jgi:hypothetical protein